MNQKIMEKMGEHSKSAENINDIMASTYCYNNNIIWRSGPTSPLQIVIK